MISIKKCPKCRHERQPHEAEFPERCPACGLYFEKWANRQQILRNPVTHTKQYQRRTQTMSTPSPKQRRLEVFCRAWLPTQPIDPKGLYGRIALLIFFGVWSVQLMRLDYRTEEINASFIHLTVILFHEAGHVFFRVFGHFMYVLGGSLFQVIFPLILSGALLWKNRDLFGALFGVWWCGASLLDVSAYIYDAKDPQLPLISGDIGGEGHDWINILGTFGAIDHAPFYAALTHTVGMLVMLTGLVLAAIWLHYLRSQSKY